MRLWTCLAAVIVIAVALMAWLTAPRHAPPSASARLADIPVVEKLHWGMTVSQVRQEYPQIGISHVEIPPRYAMYWLNDYPWRGCLAHVSLLFDLHNRLTQVWLDEGLGSPRSCKVMALAHIEKRYGEGLDQNRLDPHAHIADCRPAKPQDRTWPAHMGGVWRCWKGDGTLVRMFDGEAEPLALSKAGAEETPFHPQPVAPLF